MLSSEEARRLAMSWIDAWNRRDLERVLAHYVADCQFVSPRAADVVGRAELWSREELRAYWQKALRLRRKVEFRLDYTVWDQEQQRLVIVYFNAGDTGIYRAVELMDLDKDGLVRRGEALYGAVFPDSR